MPVEPLSALAEKACVKNIKRLFDTGECSYELLRPALMKIQSPEQLHQIEMNSPQIIGLDSEIWLNLIKRDIPNWESKPHQPTDPKNWWKVYRKLKMQAEDDLNQDTEKLKAAFTKIKYAKEQNLAQLKPRRELPKLPGSSR